MPTLNTILHQQIDACALNRSVTDEAVIPDHLGNTRVLFSDANNDGTVTATEILQQNHYYPFGMEMEGSWNSDAAEAQRYRYNGKEFSEELGLYDYGARWYDPAVARWTAVDPLAASMGSWSPYNYTFNNPIKYTDPTGMAPFGDFYNQKGKKIGTDGKDDDNVFIVTDKSSQNTIKANDKAGGTTDASTVEVALATRGAVLIEAANVLDRTIENGGLIEEGSMVRADGTVEEGDPETGLAVTIGDQKVKLDIDLPAAKDDGDVTVHSHPTALLETKDSYYPFSALAPSDHDNAAFESSNQNVIVGRLGKATMGTDGKPIEAPLGAAFFKRGSSTSQFTLSQKALNKIRKDRQ